MKKQLKEERVWIVVGTYGRYYGCFRTRNQAKAYHAHIYHDTSEYVMGRTLSPEQQAAWNKRADDGDRVVRATLIWEE